MCKREKNSGNKDNSLDVISRGSILRRKEHEYKSRMGKRKKELKSGIPDDVMEGFAKALLPEIRGFYESEKGKAFFEKNGKPKKNKMIKM